MCCDRPRLGVPLQVSGKSQPVVWLSVVLAGDTQWERRSQRAPPPGHIKPHTTLEKNTWLAAIELLCRKRFSGQVSLSEDSKFLKMAPIRVIRYVLQLRLGAEAPRVTITCAQSTRWFYHFVLNLKHLPLPVSIFTSSTYRVAAGHDTRGMMPTLNQGASVLHEAPCIPDHEGSTRLLGKDPEKHRSGTCRFTEYGMQQESHNLSTVHWSTERTPVRTFFTSKDDGEHSREICSCGLGGVGQAGRKERGERTGASGQWDRGGGGSIFQPEIKINNRNKVTNNTDEETMTRKKREGGKIAMLSKIHGLAPQMGRGGASPNSGNERGAQPIMVWAWGAQILIPFVLVKGGLEGAVPT